MKLIMAMPPMQKYLYHEAINPRCSELAGLSSTRENSEEDAAKYQNAALWLHGYYSGRNEAVIVHSEQTFQVEMIAVTAKTLCEYVDSDPFITDSYDYLFQK